MPDEHSVLSARSLGDVVEALVGAGDLDAGAEARVRAAGPLEDVGSGRHVPGVGVEAHRGVRPSGCDVSEVQGSAAGAVVVLVRARDLGEQVEGALAEQVDVVLPGEAREQGRELGGAGRRSHRCAVQVGELGARREHVVGDGVEHDARDDFSVELGGDRDAPVGETAREVGGAVDRVDDPAQGGLARAAGLFAQDDRAGCAVWRIPAMAASAARSWIVTTSCTSRLNDTLMSERNAASRAGAAVRAAVSARARRSSGEGCVVMVLLGVRGIDSGARERRVNARRPLAGRLDPVSRGVAE